LRQPWRSQLSEVQGSPSSQALGWQSGVSAAASYYDALVKAMEHPVINYFAADCFFNNGDRDRAAALLDRALALCDEQPEQSAEFRPLIEEFRQELRG